MSAVAGRGLRAELRALETAYPGWHCWISSEGRLWACTSHYSYPKGSGITVCAGAPSQLGHAIAEAVHEWELTAA